MIRTVQTVEARARLGQLVDQARYRGDSVIIEKNGQPAAALVPLELLYKHQRTKRDAAKAFRDFAEDASTGLSEDEIARLIDREVATVRAIRSGNSSRGRTVKRSRNERPRPAARRAV